MFTIISIKSMQIYIIIVHVGSIVSWETNLRASNQSELCFSSELRGIFVFLEKSLKFCTLMNYRILIIFRVEFFRINTCVLVE